MAVWDVKIGFDKNISCSVTIEDNATPKQVANLLATKNLIDSSEICGEVHLLPEKYGSVCLVDDSGYPYATLIKKQEQTLGEVSSQSADQANNIPKCPTCGSTNIETINLSTRAAATVLLGVVSNTARKQMVCKNCGYKF